MEEDMSKCWLSTQEGRFWSLGSIDDGVLRMLGGLLVQLFGQNCDKMIPFTDNVMEPVCIDLSLFILSYWGELGILEMVG